MYSTLLFNVTSVMVSRKLGVYRMASWLRENNWDVEVIDFTQNWTVEQLKALARSRITKNTKFIGFGHMFSEWTPELEVFAAWVKIEYPDMVIISGSGVAPDFKSSVIDYYIKGFGEYAILALLKWLFSNGPRPVFELEKVNGGRIINANSVYPAYPMKKSLVTYEERDFLRSDEWLTTETARGCKFQCSFCNFPVLGVKGDYSRDSDDFELELKTNFDKWGTTNYLLVDETFNDRPEKITKFANVVEKLPFVPWFSGFIRADLSIGRPHEREELLRMNFLGQHYGIETFNHTAGKYIGKGMHPDKIKQGLIDLRQYYETHGRKMYRGYMTLIAGLPTETKEELEQTKAWVLKNWTGQSFSAYALVIPKPTAEQKSLMTKDFYDQGYQVLSDEEIARGLETHRINKHSLPVDSIYWKNEHMDVFEATEIEDGFWKERQNPANDFRIDIWKMAGFYKASTLEERLQIVEGSEFVFNDPDQEYISKKLNYSK